MSVCSCTRSSDLRTDRTLLISCLMSDSSCTRSSAFFTAGDSGATWPVTSLKQENGNCKHPQNCFKPFPPYSEMNPASKPYKLNTAKKFTTFSFFLCILCLCECKTVLWQNWHVNFHRARHRDVTRIKCLYINLFVCLFVNLVHLRTEFN